MRVLTEKTQEGPMARVMTLKYGEVAYIVLGLSGLGLEVETPSDWHENRLVWVRLGLGLFRFAVAFPWPFSVPPDEYQCSGPTYGFKFVGDYLSIRYGKSKGKKDDPSTAITMPWGWKHKGHLILSGHETHPYKYWLKSGECQVREATIRMESRRWTRPWLPWERVNTYIDVTFNDEVGERSGSWKGGVLGCSFDMVPNESPVDALRRMESTRRFR